jgi:hypothetical protein
MELKSENEPGHPKRMSRFFSGYCDLLVMADFYAGD